MSARLVTNNVKTRVKRRRRELINEDNIKSFQLYADLREVSLKGIVNYVLKDWMVTQGLPILGDMFDKVNLTDVLTVSQKSCNPFRPQESDILTPTSGGEQKKIGV